MKWTKYYDDKVIKLITDGLSYREISEIIDTTPDSIRGRCSILKIKSSDYTKDFNRNFECLECGKEFVDNKDGRKFCSNSCSAIFNNKNIDRKKKLTKKCLNCDCDISNKNSKYCSQKCQVDFEYNNVIEKWKNKEIDGNIGKYKDALSLTIRKYITLKYGNKCSECGWEEVNKYTGKVPLEIDHIDGDHLNSVEENLRLLCPSCHSLTEFYGARNKGRGRKYRRMNK